MSCESAEINMFYIPDLGAAPLWAKNVDTFVNDLKLEENRSLYDNYKFCTKEEIIALNL